MKTSLLFLILVFVIGSVNAKPPKPPKGYRWVLNVQFSDEFNGDKLDKSKWQNTYNGGWLGRPPAWFNPDAVWVEDGKLKIRSGILSEPKGRNGEYTMYGGAVSSTTREAHFGYYECKAKASQIAMSTTFWMANDKVPFEGTKSKRDSYSQELDIQEAIGGGTVHAKFKNGMNCNTHYRYIKPGARKEEFISKGTGTILRSNVFDEYHIYAAWWKDANEVLFYANDNLFDTVMIRTDVSQKPFDRPMQINMVTETYDWQPAPNAEDLENMDINTAYYDWVRSYKLIPVNEKYGEEHSVDLYTTEVRIEGVKTKNGLAIDYSYQVNSNATLKMTLIADDSKEILTKNLNVLKGYGHDSAEVGLDENLKGTYTLLIEITTPDSTEVLSSNKQTIKI